MNEFKTSENRIFPNKEQQKRLHQLLDRADDAFDKAADFANELAVFGSGVDEISRQIRLLTPFPGLSKPEEKDVLQRIDKLLPQLVTGDIPYIYHRDRRRSKRSIAICPPQIRGNIAIFDGIGKIPIHLQMNFPKNYRIFLTEIKSDCCGALYYLVYRYYYPAESVCQTIDPNNALGLDYAQDGLYVDSEGRSGGYPGFRQASRAQLIRYRDAVDRFTSGSSRWRKAQQRLKRYEKHIRNQRAAWQNAKADALSDEYDLICIETLDFKQMARTNPALKAKIIDNDWTGFEKRLQRKMTQKGKKLVKISAFFPSTQKCSNCGAILGPQPLSERIFSCRFCDFSMDRDQNAAINILEEGKRQFCSAA